MPRRLPAMATIRLYQCPQRVTSFSRVARPPKDVSAANSPILSDREQENVNSHIGCFVSGFVMASFLLFVEKRMTTYVVPAKPTPDQDRGKNVEPIPQRPGTLVVTYCPDCEEDNVGQKKG